MKLLAPAALLLVLAALVAGCGGGGTTTVIQKTVTVESKAKPSGGSGTAVGVKAGKVEGGESSGGGASGGGGESSAKGEMQEAQEPQRILHLRTFRSPSGNIGCIMFEGGARCDIRQRDWSPPARPANCPHQVDFGQGLAVPGSGQASFVCAGDTALDPSAAALAYDTASEVGGSECISRSGGITCVNRSGHGFFISIQSYQVF